VHHRRDDFLLRVAELGDGLDQLHETDFLGLGVEGGLDLVHVAEMLDRNRDAGRMGHDCESPRPGFSIGRSTVF
jgi:hypothetical protein